jgi:hypothetical protein
LLRQASRAFSGPGYSGTWPSRTGDAALRSLCASPWVDEQKRVGGGEWKVARLPPTLFSGGPGPSERIEIHSVTGKGPHVQLTRGALALSFPVMSDGDVAATLRWLGRPVPEDLVGEAGPQWRLAADRVAALGAPGADVRVGLRCGEKPGQVEILVWNVGDAKVDVRGTTTLVVDGVPLPLPLRQPPKADPGTGNCALALESGSLFVLELDVAAHVRASAKPALAPGTREIELLLTRAAANGASPVVVRSRRIGFAVASVSEPKVPEPKAGK